MVNAYTIAMRPGTRSPAPTMLLTIGYRVKKAYATIIISRIAGAPKLVVILKTPNRYVPALKKKFTPGYGCYSHNNISPKNEFRLFLRFGRYMRI